MENKLELLEKLIKEGKVTLKEALVLLEKEPNIQSAPYVAPYSPYTSPQTNPVSPPYSWYDPLHVTCTTTNFPNGTVITHTN